MTNLKLHHFSLSVCSSSSSEKFYCSLLGFEKIIEHKKPDGRSIVHLRMPGDNTHIELIEVDKASPAKDVHIGFSTTSFEDVLSRLIDFGVTIERGPLNIGHENIVFIQDPDGYLIEINDGLEVS